MSASEIAWIFVIGATLGMLWWMAERALDQLLPKIDRFVTTWHGAICLTITIVMWVLRGGGYD